MLPGLRHHSLIGRHHHQDQVHTSGAREHVANEALVARDVHHAHPKAFPGSEVCESELDRDAAGLLLLQAIGIHTGQQLHERSFAVIDMAGGTEDQALLGHSSKPASTPNTLNALRGLEPEI